MADNKPVNQKFVRGQRLWWKNVPARGKRLPVRFIEWSASGKRAWVEVHEEDGRLTSAAVSARNLEEMRND